MNYQSYALNKIAEVGRQVWRMSSPLPCSEQVGSAKEGCSGLCCWVLSISKDRDSTTALENLLQCLFLVFPLSDKAEVDKNRFIFFSYGLILIEKAFPATVFVVQPVTKC